MHDTSKADRNKADSLFCNVYTFTDTNTQYLQENLWQCPYEDDSNKNLGMHCHSFSIGKNSVDVVNKRKHE